MEFIDFVINFIKELGFPIACVCALFIQNQKLTESHKEEMTKTIEALNNNTLALQELKNKIGG